MDISLAGKVALVTGAGPNIGGGIGLALARYGATVACNDIDPDAAAAAVERIERNGGRAIAVPGDVTDEDQVAGYVDQVVGELGGIDILVNNAALLGGKGVLDESAEFFDRAVRVAGLGSFLNTRAVGRHMAERGTRGSIVLVSSSNGWSGSAGVIAYAFHKGGVNNNDRPRRPGRTARRSGGRRLRDGGDRVRRPAAGPDQRRTGRLRGLSRPEGHDACRPALGAGRPGGADRDRLPRRNARTGRRVTA